MGAESLEVPFTCLSDGRRYLTAEQLQDDPYLARFVAKFKTSFRFDPDICVYWFDPPVE